MNKNKCLVTNIYSIVSLSKGKTIRALDTQRTLMLCQIGKRIFEEEQQGKERSDFGKYLIEFLAQELETDYGNEFS